MALCPCLLVVVPKNSNNVSQTEAFSPEVVLIAERHGRKLDLVGVRQLHVNGGGVVEEVRRPDADLHGEEDDCADDEDHPDDATEEEARVEDVLDAVERRVLGELRPRHRLFRKSRRQHFLQHLFFSRLLQVIRLLRFVFLIGNANLV